VTKISALLFLVTGERIETQEPTALSLLRQLHVDGLVSISLPGEGYRINGAGLRADAAHLLIQAGASAPAAQAAA
jgi:hypothetical protein